MEVDTPPQLNGFSAKPDSEIATSTNGHPQHVKFSGVTEVKTYTVVEMESPTQVQRQKHKARRRARVPKLELEEEGAAGQSAQKPLSPSKLKKMADKDRHSRTGRRGLPKKGGAGGKGTWGKMTEGYDEDSLTHDNKDPNYNSDDQEAYVVSPSSPLLNKEEFQKQAVIIFKEYFDHGDTQEVAESLEDFNIWNLKHEIVHVLLTLVMEEKAANREKASVLLSDLYGQLLNTRDIAAGFDLLLRELEELSLDTPDAADILGNFIARCVADDCLPPAFVSNHTKVTDAKMLACLKRAKVLLSMKHGIARLDNVWGVGGGQRPVMFLISKMNLLLKEFLSSSDYEEAVRCLRELEVPHFHHELVYEAVVLALEDGKESCAEKIVSLLQHMAQATIITQDQFNQGFLRIFNDMTDIVLDVPNAYHMLSKFVDKGEAAGFVRPAVAEQLPQRGRKRFVSEGDGGAIKPPPED